MDNHLSKKRPTVSIVVITKDEERNLRECLDGAKWADEIVVVDAQSTDQTVKIAREYTPEVFVRLWQGFGPQKNFGIHRASSDWVFILDADERISPELAEEIKRLLERESDEGLVAYRVPRRNFYYGRWLRWGGVYPDYQVRLFRNGTAWYNEVRIHENLVVQGQVETLRGHLNHYTERQIGDHFKKFPLYTSLAAQEMQKTKHVVHWFDLIASPLVTFTKAYLLKQGIRDGIHGFVICVFASMYTFVKYAKFWESCLRPSEGR